MRNLYRRDKEAGGLEEFLKWICLPGYSHAVFHQFSKDKDHSFSKQSKLRLYATATLAEILKYGGIVTLVYNTIQMIKELS